MAMTDAPRIDTKPTQSSKVSERVTVNLTHKSVKALSEISELTGDSKTEAINKALQLYALVQAAQNSNGGLWLQDGPGAEMERIRFF